MVIRIVIERRNMRPGELWEIPDDEAARLVEDGAAVPVTAREALYAAKETR